MGWTMVVLGRRISGLAASYYLIWAPCPTRWSWWRAASAWEAGSAQYAGQMVLFLNLDLEEFGRQEPWEPGPCSW